MLLFLLFCARPVGFKHLHHMKRHRSPTMKLCDPTQDGSMTSYEAPGCLSPFSSELQQKVFQSPGLTSPRSGPSSAAKQTPGPFLGCAGRDRIPAYSRGLSGQLEPAAPSAAGTDKEQK